MRPKTFIENYRRKLIDKTSSNIGSDCQKLEN